MSKPGFKFVSSWVGPLASRPFFAYRCHRACRNGYSARYWSCCTHVRWLQPKRSRRSLAQNNVGAGGRTCQLTFLSFVNSVTYSSATRSASVKRGLVLYSSSASNLAWFMDSLIVNALRGYPWMCSDPESQNARSRWVFTILNLLRKANRNL